MPPSKAEENIRSLEVVALVSGTGCAGNIAISDFGHCDAMPTRRCCPSISGISTVGIYASPSVNVNLGRVLLQ